MYSRFFQAAFLRNQQISAASIFVATLFMVGCGDPNSVTGIVTLDNEPLAGAMLQFTPEDAGGRIALAKTDAGGAYKLKTSKSISNVSPGRYKVSITTSDVADEDASGNAKMSKEKVPAKYNSKTELIEEVQEGSNVFNFDLTN